MASNTRIEAFRLTGRVEIDSKTASRNLKQVERDADATDRKFKGLRGSASAALRELGSGGGLGGVFKTLSNGGDDFLGKLGNISEIVQGIPVVGGMAAGLIKTISAPVQSVIQMGVEFNDTIEMARVGMKTLMGGDVKKADAYLNSLKGFAKSTPFEFQPLVKYSQQLMGVGFAAEQIQPMLTDLGDALSGVGATDRLDEVIKQIGQMRAKGKASFEELGTIAETGIPVWQILAKQVGVTDREMMKFVETGKVNADAAIKFLLEGMREKYGGLMSEMAKTRLGALSNFKDAMQQRAGEATVQLHGQMTTALNQGADLINGRGGAVVASAINTASGAVGQVFNMGLKALTSGDLLTNVRDAAGNIIGTLTDTITKGKDSVTGAARSVADATAKAIDEEWEIESPSRRARRQGRYYIEGLSLGLKDGQARVYENMRKLFEREPDFLPKLLMGARKRGINPDHILNVIGVETGGSFNPAAKNPNSSASGLIQFMRDTARQLGTTTANIRALSATEQLDLVFAYFDQKKFRGRLNTQSQVYSAVGTGRAGGNDEAVRFTRADGDKYRLNASTWDRDRDGVIRQGELGAAAYAKLGAGVKFTVNGAELGSRNPLPVSLAANSFSERHPARETARELLNLMPRVNFMPRPAGSDGAAAQPLARDVGLPVFKRDLNELLQLMPPLNRELLRAETTASRIRIGDPNDKKNKRDGATKPQTEAEKLKELLGGDEKKKPETVVQRMKRAVGELKAMGKEAFGDFAQGIGGMVNDFVLLGDTGPDAMRKLTAQVLASVASQATVLAVFELAKGFAALFFNPAEAGAHFTAAALFGSIAGVTAIAGRAVAGDLFKKDKGDAGSQSAAPPVDGARENGGNVYAGRSYIVGEKRPEVFTAPTDGRIEPSMSAHDRAQEIRAKQQQLMKGGLHGWEKQMFRLLDRFATQLEGMEAMTPGQMLHKGVKEAPGAVGNGMVTAMDKNAGLIDQLQRRIVPA